MSKRVSYMNTAEVMDKVFDVYKRSFLYQIGLNFCVYTIGAGVLYAVLLVLALTGIFVGSVFDFNGTAALGPEIIALIVLGAFAFIWACIIYANLITGATGLLSWQSYSNRPIHFTHALKGTFKSSLHIASVSLAEMIAGIPVILLIILSVYAIFAGQGVFTGEYWSSGRFVSFFTPANILLAVIIGLSASIIIMIVYNYFALAVPIAIFDRKHFFSALVSSYVLMKGDFWRILGARAVFAGAIMLINYSFSSIAGLLLGLSAGLSGSFLPSQYGLTVIGIIIQYIVSLISSILLMPLTGIFTSIIFFNQKTKKEGLDLAMQLELLERANGF